MFAQKGQAPFQVFRSAQTAFRRMRQLRSLSREAYHVLAFVITPICR